MKYGNISVYMDEAMITKFSELNFGTAESKPENVFSLKL